MKKNIVEQNQAAYRIAVTGWSINCEKPYAYHIGYLFDSVNEALDAIKTDADKWLRLLGEPEHNTNAVVEFPSASSTCEVEFNSEGFDAIIRAREENVCRNLFGYNVYPLYSCDETAWMYRSDFRIVHCPESLLYGVFISDKCIGMGQTLGDALTFVDRYMLERNNK